jgi:UrcA family protein
MLKFMIPAALLSALLPGTALAQLEAPADIHVAYRDLNLQSPAGVQVLDRRIKRAIVAVCPDVVGSDMARQRLAARCWAAKWAEVATQRAVVLDHAGRVNIALAAEPAAR